MSDGSAVFSDLPAVGGKPVRVAFDGRRLTSDGGVLLLAEVERRLRIAERLARCIEDPRDPAAVRHSFAEMIRFRALLIACGYPGGNDCDACAVIRRSRWRSAVGPTAAPTCARSPPSAGWRTCPARSRSPA
jgi:Transposase DDE domain group 1